MSALRCNVADLLHHPAARRPVHLETDASPSSAGVAGSRLVDQPARRRPRARAGARRHRGPRHRPAATGRRSAAAACEPVAPRGRHAGRRALRARPVDGETYPLEGDEIDLEQLVRDTVLLDLPAAPLCRDDCAGLCPACGADRNRARCDCDTDRCPIPGGPRSLELTFDD